jgi:SAM-dependent methyltransferase
MDISIVALKEARKRLGDHGLYIVGDIAHLPFREDIFDGIVSLHTIHHVSLEDKIPAYLELYRVLKPGRTMAVVNGWTNAPLMVRLRPFMRFMRRLRGWWQRKIKGKKTETDAEGLPDAPQTSPDEAASAPAGTFVQKLNADWLTQALKDRMPFEIFVWRSVSVAFLRSVIYADWGGRFWLRVLFWLEERFPKFFGRKGQYPLIVIHKTGGVSSQDDD